MPTSSPRKLGLFLATMFVTGNMVGSGLFLLPASMGTLGGISIFSWLLATAGALLIAGMFARLGSLAPWAGGPYAYARATLGPYVGFQTNYIYWLACWVGNVAIALVITGYLSDFIPSLRTPLGAACGTAAVLWAGTLLNILGPRAVGGSGALALFLGLGPILAIAVLGWFWFDPTIFAASWNVSGKPMGEAVPGALVLVFWAFLGIETAAVAAEVVEHPRRNLPIAVIAGVCIAAVVYAASCTVLMGILPAGTLAASPSPFALVAGRLFGPLAAVLVGIAAIIKTAGSLGGWVLVCASTAKAAADDGSFPALFGRVDARGIPVINLLVHGVLMTLVVFATISPTLSQQFSRLVDVTVVFTLVIYLYSALALFRLAPAGHPGAWRDRALAVSAATFAGWVMLASDRTLLLVALAIMATSAPVYWLFERRRVLAGVRAGG